MAAETEDFDVKIRIIFPSLTKSLPQKDSERINATGTFNFEPQPQVDTTQGIAATEDFVQETNNKERVATLKNNFDEMIAELDRIGAAFEKRAKHITLEYDPELAENEALANAEMDIFGSVSGKITYEMFKQTVDFENKINKFISHQAIENEGVFGSVA